MVRVAVKALGLLALAVAVPAAAPASEPQSGACGGNWSAKERAQAPTSLRTGRLRSRSECGLITADRLSQEQGTEWLVVDVRSRDQYDEYRIGQSLNMAAYEIKAKTFLREQNIVLVDEGFGYAGLFALCHALGAAGFSHVSVLDGGLNLWRRMGKPWEGRASAYAIPMIEAKAVFEQYLDETWLILSLAGLPQYQELLEPLFRIVQARDSAELQARLEQALASTMQGQVIVVATGTGDEYPRLESALTDRPDANVFFLNGGLRALADHVQWQKVVWSKQAFSLSRGPRCAAR